MAIVNKNVKVGAAIDLAKIDITQTPYSTHLYMQLPEVATGSLEAAAAGNEGGIVYDSTTNTVKFSDGSSWANVSATGSAETLDATYNAGNNIDIDAGGGDFEIDLNAAGSRIIIDADTNATTVTDAIIFATSGTSSVITDAIDASDAGITNAINVGANVITGTTYNVTATNWGVTGSTGALTCEALDRNSAGSLTIGGSTANALTLTPATTCSSTLTVVGNTALQAGLTHTGGNPSFTTTATTGNGFAIDGSTVTTGNVLAVEYDATNSGAGFGAIEVTEDGAAVWTVGEDGNTVIGGTAAGTAALTLSLGDLTITDTDSTSITSVNGTTSVVTLDNAGGVQADNTALLLLDAGGNNASGSNMLRLAPTGTPVEGSIGVEFVGAGKVMQALSIDCDSAANSCVLINGGGAVASGKGVVEITNDGNLASGGTLMSLTVGGTPNTAAIGLDFDCQKDCQALKIDTDALANDAVYFTHTGNLASGKAVFHVTDGGTPADDTVAVGKFAFTGTATNESSILRLDGTGKDVIGLRVDTDNTVASNSGSILLYSDAADAQGPSLVVHQDSATPAANDQLFGLYVYGEEATSSDTMAYAQITCEIVASTDGAIEGGIKMGCAADTNMRESFYLTDNHLGLGDSAAFVLGSTGSYDLSIGTAVTAAGLGANEPNITMVDGASGDITITAGATDGSTIVKDACIVGQYRHTTSDDTLDNTDYIVHCESSGSSVALTLPQAANNLGQHYLIYFATDDGNDVVVTTTAGDSYAASGDIGDNTATMADAGDFMHIVAVDADRWAVLENNGVTFSTV